MYLLELEKKTEFQTSELLKNFHNIDIAIESMIGTDAQLFVLIQCVSIFFFQFFCCDA